MKLKLAALKETLRSSLWFIPTLSVLASIGLALGTLLFDIRSTELPFRFGFTGSAASARAMLGAIAGAVITLTALVFSVTIVVLQLASSQYSPRVLRTFLRDRTSQFTLAAFLSTFAFSMVVMRAVKDAAPGDAAFVPNVSLNLAFLFVGVSLAFFVAYVHHIAKSMQAAVIVGHVAAETRKAIEDLYPHVGGKVVEAAEYARVPPEGTTAVRNLDDSGYLQGVADAELLQLAGDRNLVIEMLYRVGDFVPKGSILYRVHGEVDDEVRQALGDGVTLATQRTMTQDPAFGLRQLVDIAEKALSAGINDPTTAVQAIDRIHEMLLMLAEREIPDERRADDSGRLCLILPAPDWNSYVHLAFDEIRQYGAGSVQVSRRLKAMVDDLLNTVPRERRAPLLLQQELLDASAVRNFDDYADVRRAKEASQHG